MRPSQNQRSLRRMVVQLSALSAADRDDVLDRLNEEERKTVLRLLGEFATHDGPSSPGSASTATLPVTPVPVLSDTLLALLDGSSGSPPLTPAAHRALREAARRHGWSPSSLARTAGSRSNWLMRLWGWK